jgi:hypothetical protein
MVALRGDGYRVAGKSKASASPSDDLRGLTVLSKKLDRILEVYEANIADMRDNSFMDEAFDFVLRSKFESVNTRWRVSDKGKHPRNPRTLRSYSPHLAEGAKQMMKSEHRT